MPPLPVLQDAGSKLIYRAATGLEKAMADVEVQRILGTYAEIIIDQWDPYAISANNLPYLAWAMGTNLWESDYWSEAAKREWVANQWTFKSIRGTPDAFKMALKPSGYHVTDIVRPPQGFFASPELTKEQWDAWIRQMPELRIFFDERAGTRGEDEFFVDGPDPLTDDEANVGFADADAAPINDGWVLRGRRAVIRHRGVDTPVYSIEYNHAEQQDGVVDFERISTFGKSTHSLIADEGFADEDFGCAEEVVPKLYTLRLDRNYGHDLSTLGLTTVVPDLEPLTPRYERNSDVGYGNGFLFSDGDYSDTAFADHPDGGDKLLADRIYLLDPEVTEPMMEGVSFADESRVGIPLFTAELQIDLHTKELNKAFFAEASFAEEAMAIPEDLTHIDRALRAVVEAKALRDTILVSFAPIRPVAMGDYLQVNTPYGGWVANPL